MGDRSSSEVQQEKKSQLVTANSGQCASTIMKLICPKEAEFMDDAAGTRRLYIAWSAASEAQRVGVVPSDLKFEVNVWFQVYFYDL